MSAENKDSKSKEETKKKSVLDSLKKRTNYLLSKPVIEDSELYHYVKDFFKDYLELDKELSFGEINQEIDRRYVPREIKEEIKNYLSKVRIVEYKYTDLEEEQLKTYIKEFFELAKKLPSAVPKKSCFITRLLGKMGLKKKKETRIEENIEKSKLQDTELSGKESLNEETEKEDVPEESFVEEKEKLEDAAEIDVLAEENQDKLPDFEQESQDELPDFEQESQDEEVKDDFGSLKDELDKFVPSEDFSEDPEIKKEEPHPSWMDEDSHEQLREEIKEKPQEEGPEEQDVFELIKKAKKLRKREKLVEAYKEINHLYEQEPQEKKAEIYPELLELYEKIVKEKE